MDTQTAITVSDLTKQIQEILEGAFPQLWVEGEISNFKHHTSGHMYFTLKDKSAEIRCVMFKGYNQFLRFKPKDGMHVLLQGKITVYVQRGQYQLMTVRIEPAGLGTLYLAFEALKKELSNEGLFADELKKPLPVFPKRIGLITSKTSAAVRDMIQVFKRRSPYVELVLRSTRVQGEMAGDEIVAAIQEMDSTGNVDLIILGRGGGSLEDLWPFNEEKVARAIFSCRTPLISAVGHETDITISDMVADHRAPTPSEAAEIAAPSVNELIQMIDFHMDKLSSSLSFMLETCWQNVDHLQDRFALQLPITKMEKIRDKADYYTMLIRQQMLRLFKEHQGKFAQLQSELEVLNPKNILNRGYAIASKENGSIIRHPDDVEKNEKFNLLLAEGTIIARKEKNNHIDNQKT